MSLGGAYTDFTNFLKNIGRVYGDINLTGQIYRGVGSLFQQPPGDMSQFPLPSGLGKGLPFPPGAPSVTNSPNPLPQDPISQYEDTVGVVGRFYRPFDKPIVTPPPQNTSTVDPTFDFAEGGEVAPTLSFLEEERPVEQTMTPEEQYGVIKAPDSPLMAKAAEIFRGVERRVAGSPAEFMLPGGGIATVLERKAYGEDPSALEYGFAALDTADVTPVGKFFAIFGGLAAKGAKNIQQRVDKLREQGLEGQDLWNAQANQSKRGYYDPSDGQFRVEFDTSKADIKASFEASDGKTLFGPGFTSGEKLKLDDVLDFPQVFEAYPQFREITVKPVPLLDSLDTKGAYDATTKTMYLRSSKDREAVVSTALHELQHAIQTEEDFRRGASTSTFLPKNFAEIDKEVRNRKKTLEKELKKEVASKLDVEKVSYRVPDQLSFVFKLVRKNKNVPDLLRDVEELSEITDVSRKVELRNTIDKKTGGGFNERYELEALMETFGNDPEAVLEMVDTVRPLLPLYGEATEDYFKNRTRYYSAIQQYRAVPGEVEARNVQARREDPDLKQQYPPTTAEVSAEKMIYPIDPNYRRPYLKIGQQGPEPKGMARGGGVGSLAPIARNMFNGSDIKRGVGAYIPYTRR